MTPLPLLDIPRPPLPLLVACAILCQALAAATVFLRTERPGDGRGVCAGAAGGARVEARRTEREKARQRGSVAIERERRREAHEGRLRRDTRLLYCGKVTQLCFEQHNIAAISSLPAFALGFVASTTVGPVRSGAHDFCLFRLVWFSFGHSLRKCSELPSSCAIPTACGCIRTQEKQKV
jgi:hypothetical protein